MQHGFLHSGSTWTEGLLSFVSEQINRILDKQRESWPVALDLFLRRLIRFDGTIFCSLRLFCMDGDTGPSHTSPFNDRQMSLDGHRFSTKHIDVGVHQGA